MKLHNVLALVMSACVMNQTVYSMTPAMVVVKLREKKAAERAVAASVQRPTQVAVPGPTATTVAAPVRVAARAAAGGAGVTRASAPATGSVWHTAHSLLGFCGASRPAAPVHASAPAAVGGAGVAAVAAPAEPTPLPGAVTLRPAPMSDTEPHSVEQTAAQHIIDHTDSIEPIAAHFKGLIMASDGGGHMEDVRATFAWGINANTFLQESIATSITRAFPALNGVQHHAVCNLLCKELFARLTRWWAELNSDESRTAAITAQQQIKYVMLSTLLRLIEVPAAISDTDIASIFDLANETFRAQFAAIDSAHDAEIARIRATPREEPAPVSSVHPIPVVQSNAPEVPAESTLTSAAAAHDRPPSYTERAAALAAQIEQLRKVHAELEVPAKQDPLPADPVAVRAPLTETAPPAGAAVPVAEEDPAEAPYDIVTAMENVAQTIAGGIIGRADDTTLTTVTNKLKELIMADDGMKIDNHSVSMWVESMTRTLLKPLIPDVVAAGIHQAIYHLLCRELLARITPWGIGLAFSDVQRTKYDLVVDYLGQRTVDPLSPIRAQVTARRLEHRSLATASAS